MKMAWKSSKLKPGKRDTSALCSLEEKKRQKRLEKSTSNKVMKEKRAYNWNQWVLKGKTSSATWSLLKVFSWTPSLNPYPYYNFKQLLQPPFVNFPLVVFLSILMRAHIKSFHNEPFLNSSLKPPLKHVRVKQNLLGRLLTPFCSYLGCRVSWILGH